MHREENIQTIQYSANFIGAHRTKSRVHVASQDIFSRFHLRIMALTLTDRDAFTLFIKSQCIILCLIQRKQQFVMDDIVFLPLRSRCLTPQRAVYDATKLVACAICMHDFFPEMLHSQHDLRHPSICRRCGSKLTVCPFCRVPIPYRSEEEDRIVQPIMLRLMQLYSVHV